MKEIIRTIDKLARMNRYLTQQLNEIARIASSSYPTNEEEHDALLDCAAIAGHAIEFARNGGAS